MNYNTLRKFSFGNVLQDVETKELFLELKLFDARFPAKDIFLALIKFLEHKTISDISGKVNLEIYYNPITTGGAYAFFTKDSLLHTLYPVSNIEMQLLMHLLDDEYKLLKYCLGKPTGHIPFSIVSKVPYSTDDPMSEYGQLRSKVYDTLEEAIEAMEKCKEFNPVVCTILKVMPKG